MNPAQQGLSDFEPPNINRNVSYCLFEIRFDGFNRDPALVTIFDNEFAFEFDSSQQKVNINVDGRLLQECYVDSNYVRVERSRIQFILDFVDMKLYTSIFETGGNDYNTYFLLDLEQYGVTSQPEVRDNVYLYDFDCDVNSFYMSYIE